MYPVIKNGHQSIPIVLRLRLLLLSRLDAPPLPPLPDPAIHLLPRHAVPDEPERDPQLRLYVAVPRLVVEEQHVLVGDPARLLDARKVLRLRPREDLDVIEVVERADGARVGGRVVREGGDDVEGLEHVAGEVWGVCAGGDPQGDGAGFARMDDGGDGGVEGEGFTPSGERVKGVSVWCSRSKQVRRVAKGEIGPGGELHCTYLSTQRELLSRGFTGGVTCVSTQKGHSV